MNNNVIKMGKGNQSWEGNYNDGDIKTITFCVTEDCNLECKYCYMTGKNNKKKMNFNVAQKAIEYIFNNPKEFPERSVIFDFIGGEPFLEIELIDKICDYVKAKMFMFRPDWFDSYRFSFSSNGLLYSSEKVQKYVKKHYSHLSIGISIDGNKRKHDLQRVFHDGGGSYDTVMKNVELWKEQFRGISTKATFSSDDLPFLKDSIISLWENGITDVSANVIFENVWKENDDLILEDQLDQLGDYVLGNKLWDKCHVRFFDSFIGNPLDEDSKKRNFCGSGKMLAIDCEGNFYPCIRFLDFAVSNRAGRSIGNIADGINKNKVRAFQCLTLEDQSKKECLDCEIATGCAFCTGFNYDENGSIYERSTSICKLHKATVKSNKRFWRKYEELTGEPSPRRIHENVENYKYIQIMMSDNITPHCNYRNLSGSNNVMDISVVNEAIEFSINNGFEIAFLGEPPKSFETKNSNTIYMVGECEKKNRDLGNYITIYDNCVNEKDYDIKNSILLIDKNHIEEICNLIRELIQGSERINLVLENTESWTTDDVEKYSLQLDELINVIVDEYENENNIEVNVLTDRIDYSKHQNCTNGLNTFTLAPNGKFYICPAFYLNNPDDNIGDLKVGINNKLERLMDINNSSICKVCDAYQCKACKYLNKKLTEEYLIPSEIQCLISTCERNKSLELQKKLMKIDELYKDNEIKKIDYLDPVEIVMKGNI